MAKSIPYGKRVVSDKAHRMWGRFPGNADFVETLPAGKPSPIVQGGAFNNTSDSDDALYLALRDPDQEHSRYIKFTDDLEVVSKKAKDRSSLFSSAWYALTDDFNNVVAANKQAAGNVSEGFNKGLQETKEDLGFLAPGNIGGIMQLIVGVIILLVVVQIIGMFQS